MASKCNFGSTGGSTGVEVDFAAVSVPGTHNKFAIYHSWQMAQEETFQLQLYDFGGQILLKTQGHPSFLNQEINRILREKDAGTFILQVYGRDKSWIQKIVRF